MYGGPANTESLEVLEVETLHTENSCHLSVMTSDDEQTTVLSLLRSKIFFDIFLDRKTVEVIACV